MAYQDFTEFPVWKKGLDQLIELYHVTKQFPNEEKYGMVANVRRASNSVIHNVAEGFGRFENKDKSRSYKISRGSAYEIISHTYASKTLGFCSSKDSASLIEGYKEIIDELDKLIKTVENRADKKNPQP